MLALLGIYRREDLLAALERAVRYGAFSAKSIERILAVQARPKTCWDRMAEEEPSHLGELLSDDPTPPRPATDYQHLLFEESDHDDQTEEKDDTEPGRPGRTLLSIFVSGSWTTPTTLKVPLSAEMLDAALARADQEGLSHLNFLELIFGEPAARSRQRAIERRIREAKFREDKNLDGFRLEVQRPGDRPCPDRAVGHRRVPPPPREPRDGGAKRRRKEPSLAGAGPPLL